MNWIIGWCLILAGFVSGAGLGLFFHRENFLGGYGSFRRRLLRLGHIACAALGILNLLVALGPVKSGWVGGLFVVGGVTMPVVCWLTAWRDSCRHLFGVPVASLVLAVVLVIVNACSEVRPPATESSAPAWPMVNLGELR